MQQGGLRVREKVKVLFCTDCTRYNKWLLYNQAHNNVVLKIMTNKSTLTFHI